MEPTTYRRSAYLRQRRFSPSSIAIVAALHGAGIAAVLLAKPELMEHIVSDPPTVRLIAPENIDPPPPPAEQVDTRQVPYVVDTGVDIDRTPIYTLPEIENTTPLPPSLPTSAPPPPPAADPIIVEARFHPSHMDALQPPYPTILLRRELEGSVTVRVRIDANGRVTAVERVRADHDGFFEATRRQALRRWRFMPATRDGRPIESWQQHTVRFRIT